MLHAKLRNRTCQGLVGKDKDKDLNLVLKDKDKDKDKYQAYKD